MENIKLNNGENSVSEEHVQAVCRQILEEVCTMYRERYVQCIENIKLNNGENSVSEEHVQAACRQILEEVCTRYGEHKTEQW